MKKHGVHLSKASNGLVDRILTDFKSMRSDRLCNEHYYYEAAKLFDPRNASVWCLPGQKRQADKNTNLYTSVGVNALRRNTNYFMSNATPENGSWWGVRTTDEALMKNGLVADWCSSVARQVQAEQRKSLYIALRKAFKEMHISYGVVYQGIRRDRGESMREVFYEHVPASAFWRRKNIYGEIVKAAWTRELSHTEYFESYGEKPEGDENRKSVKIICYIERNKNFKEKPSSASEHEFIERHIDESQKKIIVDYGHVYMPFVELAMDEAINNEYPIGIAFDGLPDARSANAARKAQLQAVAYASRPPVLTNILDSISDYGKQIRPGGFIEGGLNDDGKPNIAPMDGMFRPEILTYQVADDEARVRETTLQNELLQTQGVDVTATAASIMAAERSAIVAPFINSVIPRLVKLCENHIKILLNYELLPEPPPAIAETDMEIDISSPMSMQARLHESAAVIETVQQVNFLAQAIAQTDQQRAAVILSSIDAEDALCKISAAYGTESLISMEAMNKTRRQAEQASQVASAMQMEAAQAQNANIQGDAMLKAKEVAE